MASSSPTIHPIDFPVNARIYGVFLCEKKLYYFALSGREMNFAKIWDAISTKVAASIDFSYTVCHTLVSESNTRGDNHMAIIPIKDIPSNKTLNPSQRDLIRQDIRYAIKLGVPKFEFDDERYKYNTLAGSAKEAFKSLFTNEIYHNAAIKAEKRLSKEFPEKSVAIPGSSYYYGKAAVFSSRKMEDRTHVFCSLNLNLINGLDGYLYIDALKSLYKNLPK